MFILDLISRNMSIFFEKLKGLAFKKTWGGYPQMWLVSLFTPGSDWWYRWEYIKFELIWFKEIIVFPFKFVFELLLLAIWKIGPLLFTFLLWVLTLLSIYAILVAISIWYYGDNNICTPNEAIVKRLNMQSQNKYTRILVFYCFTIWIPAMLFCFEESILPFSRLTAACLGICSIIWILFIFCWLQRRVAYMLVVESLKKDIFTVWTSKARIFMILVVNLLHVLIIGFFVFKRIFLIDPDWTNKVLISPINELIGFIICTLPLWFIFLGKIRKPCLNFLGIIWNFLSKYSLVVVLREDVLQQIKRVKQYIKEKLTGYYVIKKIKPLLNSITKLFIGRIWKAIKKTLLMSITLFYFLLLLDHLNIIHFLRDKPGLAFEPTPLITVPYGEHCHLPAPATLVAQTLREFYILLLYVILFIFGLILFQTAVAIYQSNKNWKKGPTLGFIEDNKLEFLWSAIPAIFLILLTIPSFATLYYAEYNHPSNNTISIENSPTVKYNIRCVKVEGNQWYWTYEYDYYNSIENQLEKQPKIFESRLVGNLSKDFTYKYGNFKHLASVTHPLLLELKHVTKIVVTSLDVLHSFSVPQFGIKIDAIPGQLNTVYVKPEIGGFYYGQCSELCGEGHALMPIVVQVVSKS